MTNISISDVKSRLEAGEKLNLVDVREQFERDEFNIGGIHIPLNKINSMQIDEIEELKDQEVICYCRSGNRSAQAAMVLETCGFTNVKNLSGGMLAWEPKA